MKRLKALAPLFIAAMFVGTHPVEVSAEEPIRVFLDYETQSYDQPPLLVEGTTLVPMRGIFENLGADVAWDEANQKITATKSSATVELQIGVQTAKVNGTTLTLTQKPQIVNGRTLVPLRFVSESLGAEVKWHGESRTVEIFSAEERLYNSVRAGDWDTFVYLLNLGHVDPDGNGRDNPLSMAAIIGSRDSLANEMMTTLLNAGADPDYQNETGNTPLMTAAYMGNQNGVEILLEAKADVHLKNKKGATALWQAAAEEELGIVELLREAGDTETQPPQLSDAQTEDEVIDALHFHLSRMVVDGQYENDYGLSRMEALMFLNLGTKEYYDAFQGLSETGKKKLLVEYAQDHWGFVHGVDHCYAILSYLDQPLIGIDVTGETKIEDAKIVYPKDGGFDFE